MEQDYIKGLIDRLSVDLDIDVQGENVKFYEKLAENLACRFYNLHKKSPIKSKGSFSIALRALVRELKVTHRWSGYRTGCLSDRVIELFKYEKLE